MTKLTTHIRYRAKVLPDGHIPLPARFNAKPGDELDVTVSRLFPAVDEETAKRRPEDSPSG